MRTRHRRYPPIITIFGAFLPASHCTYQVAFGLAFFFCKYASTGRGNTVSMKLVILLHLHPLHPLLSPNVFVDLLGLWFKSFVQCVCTRPIATGQGQALRVFLRADAMSWVGRQVGVVGIVAVSRGGMLAKLIPSSAQKQVQSSPWPSPVFLYVEALR